MKDIDPLQEKLLATNEALLLGSLRQHELTEAAENLYAALRESEMRFRTLFELGPAAIYTCDASGTLVDFNRRAVELWGREPVLGSPDERFCGSFKLYLPDGEYVPHDQCPMADVVFGKVPSVNNTEVLIERTDGSRITVIVNIRPLRNASGEITGAINCFYDITERKLEEEVQQRLAILTATNKKLESEITHRQAMEKNLLESERHQKQMRERAKQLAHQVLHSQEEERLRISRELHDQVVQTLIGINVRLVALDKEAQKLGPDFRQKVASVQSAVENSIDTVHRFSRDLRPTILDDLGLIPALREFLETFLQETGVRSNLTVFSGVEKLEGTIVTALYRIIQEALTNVARHAKADTVEISIQNRKGAVCMTIQDNGKGFKRPPPKPGANQRLGLIGMQERVEMLGGTFSIQSAEGKGTIVKATIPHL